VTSDQSKRRRGPNEKPVINEAFPNRFTETPVKRVVNATFEKIKRPTYDDTKFDDAKLKEGVRLFLTHDWKNALEELRNVIVDDLSEKGQAELTYYLGLCYTKLDRFDEAVPYLERVISKSSDPLRAYQCRLTLAYIYVITGRAKLAEFELKRLQKSGFESAPLYNTLAYAAYVQRRHRDAIDLYEKALDFDENNTTALNCLGYILADTGINPLKGLRLCNKAVELKPQSAAYLDSLGWAYYKCGDRAQARKLIRKALDIAPQEKEIKEHFRLITGGTV